MPCASLLFFSALAKQVLSYLVYHRTNNDQFLNDAWQFFFAILVVLSPNIAGSSSSNYDSALGSLSAQIGAITHPDSTSIYWNSGWYAPQYVQLELQVPSTITAVALRVAQLPDGVTHHQLFAGPSANPTTLVRDINGITYSNEWINITFSPPLTNIQYLLLSTISSPSWVAWGKFLVFGTWFSPTTTGKLNKSHIVKKQ
jgi:hypothetical protein